MAEKLKYSAVLVLSVLFSLLTVEAGLRLLDIPKHRVSGWTECKRPEECNYLGFRGEKIAYSADDYVIVLLGDSKVSAWSIPFELTPERRLEHYLKMYKKNVKVFTVGAQGYGQDQELLALKEYFKEHRADLVLLFHSSRTDLEDNVFPASGRNNTVKPTYWLEKGKLCGPTEGWLEPIEPRWKLALLWETYLGKTLGDLRMEQWNKDILPPPYQPLKHYDGEVDYSWQQAFNQHPVLAFKGIKNENVTIGIQLTPKSQRRQYGIDLSRQLFSEIKKLTEEQGGRFIIFKEEAPWEIDDLGKERVYLLNGGYYRISMKQYHDNLKELLYGFEHYLIPLDMDNYTVNADDAHLNQKAIDKLMKKLSIIISRKEYFKK